MSGRNHNTSALAIAAPSPEETRATSEAEIGILEDRLNEADQVVRDLQSRVSMAFSTAHPLNPGNPLVVALKSARDHATELRTAIAETRAALDRERLATIPDRFAECAKTFGAEAGSNGWASCSDVPTEALAACLDPMIASIAADQVSVPHVFNQIRRLVEGAMPAASFPFQPRELFDTSSPVRGVIVERIRQRVKQAEGHPPSH